MNKKVTLSELYQRYKTKLFIEQIYASKNKKLIETWKLFKEAINYDKRTISTTKTK